MVEYTIKDLWFKKQENISKVIYTNEEEERFYQYLHQFQNGDFSKKKEFVNFFISTSNWNIFVLGIKLFIAICNHNDFELLSDFLSSCEEKQLRVFLAYIPESLSIHAIPYLLALYEDWEETYVGDDIARCICEMLGDDYREDIHYDINELGERFIEFSKKNDVSLYYYNGKKYFVGELTKKAISVTMYCKENNKRYFADELSAIISNGTGIECPISHNVEVNDMIIQKLFDYVKYIVEFHQEIGNKYFYNHVIV